MERNHRGVLRTAVPGVNILLDPPSPVVIEAGTPFVIETPKAEWLGHEGMYSDITVPGMAGRFRVRWHHLRQAVGSTLPVAGTAQICNYVVFETASSWNGQTVGPRAVGRFATRKQADEYVRDLDRRPGKEGWYYLYAVQPEPVTHIAVAAGSDSEHSPSRNSKKLQPAGRKL